MLLQTGFEIKIKIGVSVGCHRLGKQNRSLQIYIMNDDHHNISKDSYYHIYLNILKLTVDSDLSYPHTVYFWGW